MSVPVMQCSYIVTFIVWFISLFIDPTAHSKSLRLSHGIHGIEQRPPVVVEAKVHIPPASPTPPPNEAPSPSHDHLHHP